MNRVGKQVSIWSTGLILRIAIPTMVVAAIVLTAATSTGRKSGDDTRRTDVEPVVTDGVSVRMNPFTGGLVINGVDIATGHLGMLPRP